MDTKNIIPLGYPGGNTFWQDTPQCVHILHLCVEFYEELGRVGCAQCRGRFCLATQTPIGIVQQW